MGDIQQNASLKGPNSTFETSKYGCILPPLNDLTINIIKSILYETCLFIDVIIHAYVSLFSFKKRR